MSSLYWYLALLACIGGFLFGYDTAVIGSVLDFIPYHLSAFWTGYLVAGASLGAAVGALAAGPLTDRFGRKSLLMADASIYAIGALLSAFTINAAMLITSRTLIGLAVGADSAIATAYIAEFAPKGRRGQLSIIQQWMITVGILVSYLVALLIFVLAPDSAKSVDWRVILGIGAIPAIIAVLLRARMPESPRWLIQQGRYADTSAALGKLGIDVSEEEVRRTADRIMEAEAEQSGASRGRGLWTPGVKRALAIVSVFFVFQQITGINVPFYYGPQLLGGLFKNPGDTAVHAAIAGLDLRSDPGRGERCRHLLRVPLHRSCRPTSARPAGLRGHGRVHAGRSGGRRLADRHPEDRGGHGRVLDLHRLVRDGRRWHRLAAAGRGLPDRRPRPGGRELRCGELDRQLRHHRGLPHPAVRRSDCPG